MPGYYLKEEDSMLTNITRHRARIFLLSFMIMCVAVISSSLPLKSQEQMPTVKISKGPVEKNSEVNGAKLFQNYCTVCHGKDAKGNGPATPALKTAPADLTLLFQKNGGRFPDSRVINILSNPEELAHGSRDMPIWGPIFRSMGPNADVGHLRATNVKDYLKSIQAK
jgi:hypothetical protein